MSGTTPLLAFALVGALAAALIAWRSLKRTRVAELRARAELQADREKLARLEAGATRERAELAELLSACDSAVLFVDSEQRIALVNPSAEALFADDSRLLAGRTVIQAFC